MARDFRIEAFFCKKVGLFTISEIILVLMVMTYGMIFSYLTILKHYSFRTYCWDLGIYNQAFSTAIYGKLFEYNAEFYFTPSKSFFGIHFSPFMFLILPIYNIFPRIETLLILQSFSISLGAIPIYFISLCTLKNKTLSLIFSALYLAHPFTQGMNWYDFHMEVFFCTIILFSIYYLKKSKFIHYFILLFFSLSIIEWIPIIVVFMIPYIFLTLKDKSYKFITQIEILGLTAALAISWFIFAFYFTHYLVPSPRIESKALSNFSILGVSDVLEIPIKILMSPKQALEALGYDSGEKALYILMMFSPIIYISFLYPVTLIPMIPWFIFSLFSNYKAYYNPAFQYSGLILPFIFLSAIEGFNKISKISKEIIKSIISIMIFVTFVINLFTSPISPLFSPKNSYYFDYGVPFVSQSHETIRRILMIVPNSAYVLTTNRLFPHLSNNPNAYVLPPIWAFTKELQKIVMKELKKINFEYIITSDLIDRDDSEVLYREFIEGRNYGVYAEGTGIKIYKYNYNEKPILNLNKIFGFTELECGEGEIIDDPSSTFGKAIYYKPKFSLSHNKIIWYGPYITLDKGFYKAKIILKKLDITEGDLVFVDVVADFGRTKLAELMISGENFEKINFWQDFYIDFYVSNRLTNIEVRGFAVSDKVHISLDHIEIIKLEI